MIKLNKVILFSVLSFYVSLSMPATALADVPWPMAGANPERTSWISETLPDNIATTWVKPISPLVAQHTQVIGAEGKVFVSTAAGLYAFDASSGNDVWQYPTELPLGNSPTYSNGFLYVGGLDKLIHKVQASNGSRVWTFTANGGFSSSPVIANGKVYATSRDGALYAINDTSSPSLAWKFQTGGQILQSPAYKDNTLYFASNDGYAYAVNATTGAQVWQSDADPTTSTKDKFTTNGFHTWWPVIYGEDVIFSGTSFYATNGAERGWLFCPPGTIPGTCTSVASNIIPGVASLETQSGYWPVGEKIVNISTNPNGSESIPNYFEQQISGDGLPQHGQFRSLVFFVNRTTGLKHRFDLDNDGKEDAPPILHIGDTPGIHYPPVVSGANDVLYFSTVNRSKGMSFSGGSISGWKVGTPYISLPASYQRSSDEPQGISAAGNKVYYNHCCDRAIGYFNATLPNPNWPSVDNTRERGYINSAGLNWFTWVTDTAGIPNSQSNYYWKEASKFFWDPRPELDPPCCAAVFWNENEKVGPSAYQGKLYAILGNALVALGSGGTGTNAPVLPSSPMVQAIVSSPSVSEDILKNRLTQQIQAMITSGHLKPSVGNSGGHHTRRYLPNHNLYWSNPSDLHRVLLRSLPYLSSTLQAQVKTYLQNEYLQFPLTSTSNIGFVTGTQRDSYLYPPAETQLRLFTVPNIGLNQGDISSVWSFPPHNLYALWKYAQAGLGNPTTLLTQWGTKLKTPITANVSTLNDGYLAAYPSVHNAYIAGYIGYIELAKLAGQTSSQYGAYQDELNRLLQLRVTNLKTFPDTQQNYGQCDNECYFESYLLSYNFAHMTPELADYLRVQTQSSPADKNALSILQKYQDVAPYWMMAHNGETQGEFTIMDYQQTYTVFQGLSLVKKASRNELVKYLDTPIVPVGDLYYIDNLVAILEAPGTLTATTSPSSSPVASPTIVRGDADGDNRVTEADYDVWLSHFEQTTSNRHVDGDFNADGRVNGLDYVIWLTNFNL